MTTPTDAQTSEYPAHPKGLRRLAEFLWPLMEKLESILYARERGADNECTAVTAESFNLLFSTPGLIVVTGEDRLRPILGLHLFLAPECNFTVLNGA